jgi:peptidoglycan/xylan/chitin deacetylase (PgdA/CDA1 family)
MERKYETMKTRRIVTLALSVIMMLGMVTLVGAGTASANVIAPQNRGIIFPYMFSDTSWTHGFNHAHGHFTDFDVTVPGVHTLELTWPGDGVQWVLGNSRIHFLKPNNPSPASLEVYLESVTVAGEARISNMDFAGAALWSPGTGPYFVNSAFPAGVTFNLDGSGFASHPQYTIEAFHGETRLGQIRAGDKMVITVRVGDMPTANWGHVSQQLNLSGQPMINAADVTMLRRYIADLDKPTFGTRNPNFSLENADVNGDGVVNATDVTLLRRHIAATDPSTVPLGPGKPRYFIAFTYDDGPLRIGFNAMPATTTNGISYPNLPASGAAQAILEVTRIMNNRAIVVCGANGVDPCGPNGLNPAVPAQNGRPAIPARANCFKGNVGGNACGTQSRAHLSFYVMGLDPFTNEVSGGAANAEAMLRRMLAEGHAIENHTWNHNTTPSTPSINSPGAPNHSDFAPNWTADLFTSANGTPAFIENQLNLLDNRVAQAVNNNTNFYGAAYTSSNPHRTFSYRPNHFNRNASWRPRDRDTSRPWIYGAADPWDWTGHSAEVMRRFLLFGTQTHCGNPQVLNVDSGNIDHGARLCNDGSNLTWRPSGKQWCAVRDSNYGGARRGAADGGIVLLHDGGAGWNRNEVVILTRDLIPEMQEMGYNFVTVEQLFYYMNAEPEWLHTGVLDGIGSHLGVNNWVPKNGGGVGDYAAFAARAYPTTQGFSPRIFRR